MTLLNSCSGTQLLAPNSLSLLAQIMNEIAVILVNDLLHMLSRHNYVPEASHPHVSFLLSRAVQLECSLDSFHEERVDERGARGKLLQHLVH